MSDYQNPYNGQENQNDGFYHQVPQEEPYRAGYQPQGNYQPQPNYQQPQGNYQPPKKEKKRSGAGKIIALALCFSLVGSALGAGGVLLFQRARGGDGASGQTTTVVEGIRDHAAIDKVQVDTSETLTPAQVYAQNVQSTVGITTSVTTTNFWGYQTTSPASGSGFIISPDGYILTNHHVIENSNSIKVAMYDGSSYDAKLIGSDESNDIAVLKIEATDLSPVVLGDSDSLNVGDAVVAIGNPLGELTFSLTAGYVSAKDRHITLSGGTSMNLIQTDAAINSGNSGGALFNLHGEVVGVTNAKYSSSSSSQASIDNIGFAIPINSVRSIVESIIEKGYIAKPYIGVSVGNVGQEALMYGLPQGAAIMGVTEDGPAAQAGLQEGDIVTEANGETIASSDDLVKIVKAAKAGDILKLAVYRRGETLGLNVTVDEQIQSAQPEVQSQSAQTQGGTQVYPFPFGR